MNFISYSLSLVLYCAVRELTQDFLFVSTCTTIILILSF